MDVRQETKYRIFTTRSGFFMKDDEELQHQLDESLNQCARLRDENKRLKALKDMPRSTSKHSKEYDPSKNLKGHVGVCS